MTAPPDSSLRGLWVAASAAGRVVEQLRTLEQAWASLLDSTSRLPIFHEEDLMRPLLEFLGIDAPLAGAVARSAARDAANLEGGPRPTVRRIESWPPDGPRHGEATTAASPRRPTRARRAFAPAEETIKRPRPESDGRADEIAPRPSRVTPERGSSGDGLLITRAAASRHFDQIFERAGVRAAWDGQVVVMTSGVGRVVDATAPPREAVASAHATASERERTLPQVRPGTERPVGGNVLSPRETIPAGVRADARTPAARIDQAASHVTAPRFAADNAARSEDQLSRILSPLLERVSRSPGRFSGGRRAAREHSGGAHSSPQTDDAGLSHSLPLTGLRRLAAAAPRARGLSAGERDAPGTVAGGREADRLIEPSDDFLAGTEGGEFASQLAELLRRESLRLGIGIEEA